ncbi:putative disease resistance protein RGA3 [Prunus dulcis]|uniref:putative disease resistance protein RGA3 n=1 Tax=Prunus dulcis TaxID=3755 RepID=UPI001483990E|nr:putative disease resistance protein RGA3 [Prunus dulcis]
MEMWVKKLEDIAHDADDVLDDYEYELLRRKVEIQNQMKKKVLNFLSLHNPVAFRLKIAHKIKNINASLESLNNKAASVGLVARPDATSRQVGVVLDRETISGFDQDEKYMVGREELVSDIVTDLINSSNKRETRPCVMAIVGMAGLGKTTLAKAIYHENEIGSHFNTKIWVCVSTPFDVKTILSGMLEYVEPTKAGIKGKAAICENLQEILKGKRYLLILDDVWNEDAQKWDELISCLLNIKDTQGSNILVTTRSAHVASIIQTLPVHDLRKLSDYECWLILKNKAVSDRSGPLSEDQERIGRYIAKKCAGLPLMAKVYMLNKYESYI